MGGSHEYIKRSDVGGFLFLPCDLSNFMGDAMKHKHADLIHAWADGAQIQYRLWGGIWWTDTAIPAWEAKYEYRIKPEPKPDVVVYSRVVGKFLIGCGGIEMQQLILRLDADNPNIKYTFGGEWGNLKAVEVL